MQSASGSSRDRRRGWTRSSSHSRCTCGRSRHSRGRRQLFRPSGPREWGGLQETGASTADSSLLRGKNVLTGLGGGRVFALGAPRPEAARVQPVGPRRPGASGGRRYVLALRERRRYLRPRGCCDSRECRRLAAFVDLRGDDVAGGGLSGLPGPPGLLLFVCGSAVRFQRHNLQPSTGHDDRPFHLRCEPDVLLHEPGMPLPVRGNMSPHEQSV